MACFVDGHVLRPNFVYGCVEDHCGDKLSTYPRFMKNLESLNLGMDSNKVCVRFGLG